MLLNDYMKNKFKQDTIKNSEAQKISTGFQWLDKALGGYLYAGLFCLGAPSSLGKSTFIQQLSENVADQEVDVLFFSLEMGTCELFTRGIVRELINDNPRENKKYGFGHVFNNLVPDEVLNPILERYENSVGKHLSIIEGNFDLDIKKISEIITEHRLATGKAPMIIIDYLQVMKAYDVRMNDKQNTDINIVELKRLSREYNTVIIAVSSFNRGSYDAPASFEAFKESGSIEFTSDCVLALQLKAVNDIDNSVKNKNNNKKKLNSAKSDERDIELVILKNRRGKAYKKISYRYYAKYFLFEELGEVADE